MQEHHSESPHTSTLPAPSVVFDVRRLLPEVIFLSYHEIVNDVLDGPPASGRVTPSATDANEQLSIAVTWCPICASGVVYARVVDGQVLTFGTSGKLDDDALVMYDRETESEWKQPLGQAISGPLDGHTLDVVPASVMSWQRFRSEYPDGVVLQPVYGGEDDPRGRSPQAAYDMAGYDRYDTADTVGCNYFKIFGTPGCRYS